MNTSKHGVRATTLKYIYLKITLRSHIVYGSSFFIYFAFTKQYSDIRKSWKFSVTVTRAVDGVPR